MATLSRVAVTAPTTLSHTFVVGETATDATGAVTVVVKDATGTTVASGTATHGTTGVYTYDLAGQAALAYCTVAWTGTFSGSAVTETDYLEIAGGFFFDLATARTSDPQSTGGLSDATKYPLAKLVAARIEVEDECERICDRAFVRRYRRMVLDGTGGTDILLTDNEWAVQGRSMEGDTVTIKAASVAPQANQTFVALTSTELAALVVTSDGMLRRIDGNLWTEGVRNVTVELEYGWDSAPPRLVTAALKHLRILLGDPYSSIPDRASSFTAVDGGTYRLDLPGQFKLGIPDIDAVYARYSRRSGAGTGAGAQIPASRTLTYEPQRNTLFHQRL